MANYSKSSQLGSKKKTKKGGFGSSPSKGSFGKGPSKGDFGKRPSKGSFGKIPSKGGLKSKPSTKKKSRKKVTRSAIELEAQKVFNAYIRKRDANLPCVSCGAVKAEFHAGHFKSVGSRKDLRFNEKNCHKQCRYCNIELVGNPKGYRAGILNRISEKDLEELDKVVAVPPKSTKELMKTLDLYRSKVEKGNSVEKEIIDKINGVVDDIKGRGIEVVVSEGEIISHSTEENKGNSGVDVLVQINPEIRIDTLKKIVYSFHEDKVLSKEYTTC